MTPTQDQLKKEYETWRNSLDKETLDRFNEVGAVWHWITTVFEKSIREDERSKIELPIRTIPLTQGKVAVIDSEDYPKISKYKWYYHKNGYAYSGYRETSKSMHRLILETPNGYDTDHINGNKLDNRKCNLRVATHHQNIMNRPPSPKTKSGFKGVWGDGKSWRAGIKLNGKTKHLGSFPTKYDAARKYNEEAVKAFGEFANLNVIPSQLPTPNKDHE